jgi:ABC-type polysaccharide/polyol phosphate transport system ATPase subunit
MVAGTAVVRLSGVSKRFVIRKEKSLKERIVNFGRSNLHKEEFWALRDIDLEIESASTVGLIGPNGSGKSTLLSLIGGIIQPTTGVVTRRGRLAALLELGAGFHPDLTGRENVYLNASILGLSKAQTDRHFDAIVDFSGIEPFIDTQVKFYSSGMYVRLAFAVAVHVDPDVLLVDEVLAVGDEPFQRKCMDRIHSFQTEGRTIVLVSHSLDQVAELCDRAVVLERGQIQVDGEPRDALRHLRADFEAARQEERERERTSEVASQRATRARILGAATCDSAGQPLMSMKPGEDIGVRVTVDAAEPMRDCMLGIAIMSSLGQLVYGTNTKLMGVQLPNFTGKRSFVIELPSLWLGEGSYTIQAAVAERSGVEIDRMNDAAVLTVESDGRSVGFIHTEPSVIEE